MASSPSLTLFSRWPRGAPGLGTWGNPPGGSGIQSESLAHHLMTLAMLREQGALTEEEFAAQKAKLLG